MFSEINSLVFLLLFLVCTAVCLMIYHRTVPPCPGKSMRWEAAWKLFLCGLAGLLLTVIVIYLWYAAVLLLLAAAKYLWGRCRSKKARFLILAGLLSLILLISAAGIQLTLSRIEEEEEEDAVLEDVTENRRASCGITDR